MKKMILSPLCSALVIPGLGQVINGNLKKGLAILAMVFLFFLGGTVKLIFIIRSYLNHPEIMSRSSGGISEPLHFEDFYSLIYVIVPFAMLWVYSVFEAFWTARNQEREGQSEDTL
jgi:hypothetical protein